MSDTSVKISLEISGKAAEKFLSDFTQKSEAADKSLGNLAKSGKSTFELIGSHIGKATGVYDIFAGNLAANVAVKALEATAAAAGKLFDVFITQGIAAASEQEDANRALNLALAQTGKYSVDAARDFEEFAGNLQATTGVQDEVITKNAALIQSLANLDQDGLKRATQAALDLSAATGKDLTTASELLAKAANGNTTALQKMGIEVQKGRTDAETFTNALNKLEQQFGGRAASSVNTFSGAVKLTSSAFAEVQESVGNVIVKNGVVVAVIKAVGDAFTSLSQYISANSQAFKVFLAEGIIGVLQGLQYLVGFTDIVVKAFNVVYEVVASSAKAMGTVLGAAALAAEGKFSAALDAIKSGATQTFADIGNAATKESGLQKVGDALGEIEGKAQFAFNSVKSGSDGATPAVENLKRKTGELSDEQKKLNEETKKWAEGLASANVSGQDSLDARTEQLAVWREKELISDQEYFDSKNVMEQLYYDQQFMRLQSALQRGLISKETYDQAYTALDDKRLKAEQKAELAQAQWKKKNDEQMANDRKSTIQYISTLQQSGSQELFAIGKAAAVATATIQGYQAVMMALGSFPPPLSFVMAALVGAAAAVQIAKIASAPAPSFETGGVVGGTSFTGDKIQANVNSGEMILTRSQQSELFRIANGTGGLGGGIEAKLDALIGMLAGKDERVIVNIGANTVVDTLRSELAAGRTFS